MSAEIPRPQAPRQTGEGVKPINTFREFFSLQQRGMQHTPIVEGVAMAGLKTGEQKKIDAIVDLGDALLQRGKEGLMGEASLPEQTGAGTVTQIDLKSGGVENVYDHVVQGGNGPKKNIVFDSERK